MLVVSPWSKGGYVCSQVYDHTSIVQFMERRFGVQEPNITSWRRAVCGDLTAAFDFASADDRLPALPSTSGYAPPDRLRHPDVVPVPPATQRVPAQEPGLRRARALPYDLAAAAVIRSGGPSLTFANSGAAGAVFHTRARVAGPSPAMQTKMFTVGAGHELSAALPTAAGGAYDVEVHGPNGFYRRFAAGSLRPGVEVTARRLGSGTVLRLTVTNSGEPVDVTISSGYGHPRPVTERLHTGGWVDYVLPDDTHGWYDVTVTSSGDRAFVRKLAGHVEDGRPSVSDPALGRDDD
jgi:phospholipase C